MNADGSYTRHELAADAHAERERVKRELITILENALDLVPRVSDDDPMVPALLEWCRDAATTLSDLRGAA